MALGIHLDHRQKRKAAGMGVFLNMESQRKFLKTASNAELELQNQSLQSEIKRVGMRNVYLDTTCRSMEEDHDEMQTKLVKARVRVKELEDMLVNSWRPQHQHINWHQDGFQDENTHKDSFLMDFENSCITDFNSKYLGQEHPTGPERHKNKQWAAIIKGQV